MMKRLSDGQRKLLLIIHLLFAGSMVGCSVGLLILTLNAYSTSDIEMMRSTYTSMHILARTSLPVSTIGAIVTGTLLAILTKWGLFRFYWIMAKQLLSIVTIAVGMIGVYKWSLNGITILEGATNSNVDPEFAVNTTNLLTGMIIQTVSLTALFTISVIKPWGARRP